MGVVDISCPACESVGDVEKAALGEYRCRNCGETFTPADVTADGE